MIPLDFFNSSIRRRELVVDQSKALIELIADMKEEQALVLANEMLGSGCDLLTILDIVCRKQTKRIRDNQCLLEFLR
jgi:hypothetical protein